MGVLCIRMATESASIDQTDIPIRMAMKMEQMGSAIIQPKAHIKMAETITPALPSVSAKMWRKTP